VRCGEEPKAVEALPEGSGTKGAGEAALQRAGATLVEELAELGEVDRNGVDESRVDVLSGTVVVHEPRMARHLREKPRVSACRGTRRGRVHPAADLYDWEHD
jgi:hypothetical protein